jgi:hypothetical protein
MFCFLRVKHNVEEAVHAKRLFSSTSQVPGSRSLSGASRISSMEDEILYTLLENNPQLVASGFDFMEYGI